MLLHSLMIYIARKIKGNSCGLKKKLLAENKTRWLDIGGNNHSIKQGFYVLNLPSSNAVINTDTNLNEHYFLMSILKLTEEDYKKLGKFDLIRMQHVFEHFSFEEGYEVLKVCSQLLNRDGYLLMTVPDLKTHIKFYLSNYKFNKEYKDFAVRCRLPENAPPSCFFSVFAHQHGHKVPPKEGKSHKWCYDYEGLEYQVKRVENEFKNIKKLGILHPLTGFPFTHNRPIQDSCLLAQKA